jgi:hypothetical protein
MGTVNIFTCSHRQMHKLSENGLFYWFGYLVNKFYLLQVLSLAGTRDILTG